MRRFAWLLPLAALLAVLPLWLGGDSCGKDLTFHMQSWIGAAEQFRHGVPYPRWNFLAAYNAGDPRFIFYPPLSWALGALLTLTLPFAAVPKVFTWIVLTIAGWCMFRFMRDFVPEPIALLAGCVYLANPFMLWTITGRNAYGELFAAAFCPLLLHAMLSESVHAWRVGLPLALMWLSNVPGGAIGTYLVIFLAGVRLTEHFRKLTPRPWRNRLKLLLRALLVYAGGLLYGFALAGFFLVPAFWERRYIHMADAFGTHLRPTDNLFFHRALLPTDEFFTCTEHIATAMAVTVVAALAFLWFRIPRDQLSTGRHHTAPIRRFALPSRALAALTFASFFMMTFAAAPIWRHIPGLWVVQFPWRLLFVVGACLACLVALAVRDLSWPQPIIVVVSFLIVAALAFPLIQHTRVFCTNDRAPHAIQADLLRYHTPEPTDEYVVGTGDPDFLRPDDPPYWLAASPAAYAPGTTPNPAAADPTQDWPLVPEGARLTVTPLHFAVSTPAPVYLIVNLQDYPNWHIARDGDQPLKRFHRRDGLLAVALPAGASAIAIQWHHTWDEYLGFAVSAGAMLTFLLQSRLARRAPAAEAALLPRAKCQG